jgi:NADH-quinone oxidoreductase subunit M
VKAVDLFNNHLLSFLIWFPVLGGLGVLLTGNDRRAAAARWIALATGLITFFVSVPLWVRFQRGVPDMQFVEKTDWISRFHIEYFLGVDGISMPLVLLTTLLTVVVIVAGWEVIKVRVSQYFAAFLIMEGLMIGVFCALDGVLFYLFWEAMLIPMFLIIGVWGGANRVYAAIKFFLYTLLGSLLMLVALLYLYNAAGGSFDLLEYHSLPLTGSVQTLIFLAFFAAFAVKVPMVPVHTWLPEQDLAWIVVALSLVAVVYIALVALVQRDMKKLIAYSSISHMGFVTLGFFVFNAQAMEGAVVQMISHGFVSGALFLCVGVLYDRLHSREIATYGGVIKSMPAFAFFMVFFAMANAGLPGTSGFVGEFLVILGTFSVSGFYATVAALTLVVGAAYTLWMVKRVVFGAISNPDVGSLSDLNRREFWMLGSMAVAVLLLGVWPAPLLEVMESSVTHLLTHLAESKL